MKHVVIVGAGFSGVALAVHLGGRARVTVVEPGPVGQGAAYRARSEGLRLNAPVDKMSLDPAQPLDFARFLEAKGHDTRGFVSRRRYGEYLAWHFARSAAQHLVASVVDVSPGFDLSVSTGAPLAADAVVLATGNSVPAAPGALVGRNNVFDDPWDEGALATIPRDARVLLLGAGLTALDVALVLARQGHAGEVVALSRSGRWPMPHLETPAPGLSVEPSSLPSTVRGLFRWARRAALTAPWQRVVDVLRANAGPVWSSLSTVERLRFLRVVAPTWNRYRHRSPLAQLDEVARFSRLSLRRGRVRSLDARGATIEASLVLDGVPASRSFDALVVCTGPTLRSPLLSRLEARALLRFEPADLGVTPLVPGLHVLGALRRWDTFESTAVAELAPQAAALADELVR